MLKGYAADYEVAELIGKMISDVQIRKGYERGWLEQFLDDEQQLLRATYSSKNFSKRQKAELRAQGEEGLPPLPKLS